MSVCRSTPKRHASKTALHIFVFVLLLSIVTLSVHHSKALTATSDLAALDRPSMSFGGNASDGLANTNSSMPTILERGLTVEQDDVTRRSEAEQRNLNTSLEELRHCRRTKPPDRPKNKKIVAPPMHPAASCYGMPPPRLVTIRGERHSGTNLLRSLIWENTDMQQVHPHDTEYGWKHGYLHPEDNISCHDVLLVIGRDAFSWIVKMFHEPYNMVFEDGMHLFGPFLRGRYRTQKCENPQYYRAKGMKCAFPMEVASNVVQLRTKKYRNWLSDSPAYLGFNISEPRLVRSYVRYEELQEKGQKQVMSKFFQQNCIPHREPLNEIHRYQGYREEGREQSLARRPTEDDVLSQFTVDELRFVFDNLDLTFEARVLNYTYDHVDEHIRRRQEGELEYKGPPVLGSMLETRRKNLAQQYKMRALDIK